VPVSRGFWKLIPTLVLLGISLPAAHAQAPVGVSVRWKANSETDIRGYHIYYGPHSRVYTNRVTVVGRTNTMVRVEPLERDGMYYLAMTAYNSALVESPPSPELIYHATNRPPSITITNQVFMSEDTPSKPVKFTVADAESPTSALTVTAHSSNPLLIPDQYILLDGTNGQRSLIIIPQLEQSGTGDIMLTVRDPDGASNSVTFQVTVAAVNDNPVISPIPNQTINEDTFSASLPFYVFDAESYPNDLWVFAVSSDPSLVPDENLIVTDSGRTRVLTFTPAPNAYGSCVIVVYVFDPDGGWNWNQFNVLVRPVNDAPNLDPISSFSMTEGAPTVLVPLSGINSGVPNEIQHLVVTASSSRPDIVPNPQVNYISPNPAGSLLIAPVPDASGTAVITVTVNDGQPINATTSRLFSVTVHSFNNPPVISSLPDLVVLRLPATSLQIPFGVYDPDTPPERLTITGYSSDPSFIPSSNLVFVGAGSQRTLTVTPVFGRTGLVTITVVVSDGGAAVSTSFYLLVAAAGT
jgi:hypothetical protein